MSKIIIDDDGDTVIMSLAAKNAMERRIEALEDYIRARYTQGRWRPIDTAPTDGTPVLVYAPEYGGLPELMSVCQWHADAGWCIDELRQPTDWMPMPAAPRKA